MFRVTVMVDDRKLAAFMWALDGLVVGQPEVALIRGAKAKYGKVVSEGGGTTADQLEAHIRNSGFSLLTTEELKKAIRAAGGNPTGCSYYVRKLRAAKVIGPYSDKQLAYPVIAKKE